MYTTIKDFLTFLRKALEQSYNTNIECELFFRELKLEKDTTDIEVDEEEMIIDDNELVPDLIIDNYDDIDIILYTECHFLDIKGNKDIGYVMYVYPTIKNNQMTITDFYQTPFYISYFIDSIDRFEELCIIGDAIKKAVLDVTDNREGKITRFDYENILKRVEKNKHLFMKRLN